MRCPHCGREFTTVQEYLYRRQDRFYCSYCWTLVTKPGAASVKGLGTDVRMRRPSLLRRLGRGWQRLTKAA